MLLRHILRHVLRYVLRPRLIVLLRLVVLRLMLRLIVLRLIVLRLVLLRLMMLIVLRLIVLRLMVLLLARIEVLLLARRERFAYLRLIAIVVVAIVGEIGVHPAAGLLLLVIGIALAKLLLRGGDQAEIMFGVLIIIFGGNRISGALRVAGELEIFFGDVRRRSANFYVLPIGLVHSRQRILVMVATTTFAIATAHAFVLPVSHGLLFRQPRSSCDGTRAAASVSPNFTHCQI